MPYMLFCQQTLHAPVEQHMNIENITSLDNEIQSVVKSGRMLGH